MTESAVHSDIPTTSPRKRLADLPWIKGLQADYQAVFVREWSPYFGAVVIVVITSALMASGFFWGVFGGLKLLGNYFNNLIGLGPVLGIKSELESPLMNRIAILDICLVIGAFSAALLSGQFRISRPPKLEYLWAALGGSFMGIGASLAGGCTTGGFFTPVMFSSPAGWAMWVGLLAGAFIGLKLLLWTMEHIQWGMVAPPRSEVPFGRSYYTLAGFLVILLVLYWATSWFHSEDTRLVSRAVLILAGFGLGFTLHRSRFCFSRVFREPFMTGEGEMTKAMILALALGVPAGSLLLKGGMVDPYLAIPATFWIGSVVGGLIFGIGMVFAGGCASGSLWRVGEGHVKLVVAVFFFAWIGAIASAVFKKLGLTSKEMNLDLVEESAVGIQAYLPDLFSGWGWAYAVGFGIMLVWYLLVRYNESTEKFTVF
jgi:uncharacterized membrane protein YedE/YeeE